MIEWLSALKALNPFYANIIIDKSACLKQKLNQTIENLVDKPRIISSELEIAMEEVAAEEREATSEIVCDAPVADNSRSDQLPMSFLTRASHNTKDPNLCVFESLNAALSGDALVSSVCLLN